MIIIETGELNSKSIFATRKNGNISRNKKYAINFDKMPTDRVYNYVLQKKD